MRLFNMLLVFAVLTYCYAYSSSNTLFHNDSMVAAKTNSLALFTDDSALKMWYTSAILRRKRRQLDIDDVIGGEKTVANVTKIGGFRTKSLSSEIERATEAVRSIINHPVAKIGRKLLEKVPYVGSIFGSVLDVFGDSGVDAGTQKILEEMNKMKEELKEEMKKMTEELKAEMNEIKQQLDKMKKDIQNSIEASTLKLTNLITHVLQEIKDSKFDIMVQGPLDFLLRLYENALESLTKESIDNLRAGCIKKTPFNILSEIETILKGYDGWLEIHNYKTSVYDRLEGQFMEAVKQTILVYETCNVLIHGQGTEETLQMRLDDLTEILTRIFNVFENARNQQDAKYWNETIIGNIIAAYPRIETITIAKNFTEYLTDTFVFKNVDNSTKYFYLIWAANSGEEYAVSSSPNVIKRSAGDANVVVIRQNKPFVPSCGCQNGEFWPTTLPPSICEYDLNQVVKKITECNIYYAIYSRPARGEEVRGGGVSSGDNKFIFTKYGYGEYDLFYGTNCKKDFDLIFFQYRPSSKKHCLEPDF